MTDAWAEDTIHLLRDDVLVRSVIELRHALDLITRNGAPASMEYVEKMERGVAVMEREIHRRGIDYP